MQTSNDVFILRHKDIDVAILQIDNNSEIVNCHILNHEHIPYLGSDGKRCILEWWRERSIPEGRKYLSELLKKHGCENASELLIKKSWTRTNRYLLDMSWKITRRNTLG